MSLDARYCIRHLGIRSNKINGTEILPLILLKWARQVVRLSVYYILHIEMCEKFLGIKKEKRDNVEVRMWVYAYK